MQPKYLKPAHCVESGCSLAASGLGFAPPSGPPRARMAFVGEALGYEEAIWGSPFNGGAGGVLTRITRRAGVNREDCVIANVVSCRPPNDYLVGAPWEDHAIACCRPYLTSALQRVEDNGVVVTLGHTALTSVLNLRGIPGVQVKEFHGTVHRDPTNRFWVVPTFHPSFLQRGKMNLLQCVTEDLQLADRIAQRGFQRSPCTLVKDPHIDWFRGWVTNHIAKMAADVDGTHLSIDTEFPEKVGKDESEVTAWNTLSPITRVNGANARDLGWTVPYVGEYIRELDRLFQACAYYRGWMWLWNKYADYDHLQQAGHRLDGIMAIDGMWLWKYLQSDVFRGLGFVAPFASDFGAWKHWAADKSLEADYAAADGVQNWRTCMWVMQDAMTMGLFDVFMQDWHYRDQYCLRPAYHMGVPFNRQALVKFHEDLQVKMTSVLARLKATEAAGALKPPKGYAKKPKGGPPAGILGKTKKKAIGGEAKLAYMEEGVTLVERDIDVEIRVCVTCGAEDVGPKHRCPRPRPAPKARRKSHAASGDAPGDVRLSDTGTDRPEAHDGAAPVVATQRLAALETRRVPRRRWFWQLPFNPDARAQILSYLDAKGINAPVDKKTQKKTTNKKALDDLKKQHQDDPFFQAQLDWKAVQKVDANYAVGTLALLDADDRVHPEYQPIPSTLRDSAKRPNLTNVVADKSGPQSLAAGFRKCVEARDGVPAIITTNEYAAWEAKWTPS